MNAAARRQAGGGLEGALRKLAARFGDRFDFGTQRTSDGLSLAAVRHRGDDGPGLYAVITADVNEMREALREDAEDENSPPGEAHSGGG